MPNAWMPALALDGRINLAHAALARLAGLAPRRLAWCCAAALPPVLMAFLFAATMLTGAAWVAWLAVPGLAACGIHLAGLRGAGPPRALAADPASRLMAATAALAAWLVAALAPPSLALWLGAGLALLVMATLHFEALPPQPQPPRRRPALA